jgi:hypothetical protein
MKTLYKINVVIAFLLFSTTSLFCQIVITNDNMPVAGDTIRVSSSNMLNIPDPAVTGYDHLWDYSSLNPSSQTVLEYVAPSQTPPVYQLVFNSSVANLAAPIKGIDFLDFNVTNTYEFYKANAFYFSRAGYAMTFGIVPVPLKYDLPEVLYKFPLSIESQPDSSTSELVISYPGFGYFNQLKKRVNEVDGSGTLITPYGSFNTIRLKSVIYERDSTYIDSMQMGFPIIRNIIEYKWLSPLFKVPLLTIVSEGPIYSIQYIDSVRNVTPLNVDLGSDIEICDGSSAILTATIKGGEPPYSILWSTGETSSSISVSPEESTSYLVTVTDANQNIVYDEITVDVIPFERVSLGNDTTVCAGHTYTYNVQGIYDFIKWYVNGNLLGTGSSFSIDTTGRGLSSVVIKVEFQKGTCVGSDEITVTFQLCNSLGESNYRPLIISPNPASDKVFITNRQWKNPVIRIIDMAGIEINNLIYSIGESRIELQINHLRKGIYSILVIENGVQYTGKLVVQ